MARPAHKSHRQKLFFLLFLRGGSVDAWRTSHIKKRPRSSSARERADTTLKQRWSSCPEQQPFFRQSLTLAFMISAHASMCYIQFVLWLRFGCISCEPAPPLPNWNCFAFNRLINARPSIHPLSRSSSRGHRGAQSLQETGYTADCFIAGSVTRACAHFTCLGPFWEEGRRPKVIRNRWNLCDLSNMVLFRIRKHHFQSKFTCLVLK